MEAQADKLKWLNRTELELLSDKSLSLQEREKLSESLKTANKTWNKVCLWSFLYHISYIYCFCDQRSTVLLPSYFKFIQMWAHFTDAYSCLQFLFIHHRQKHMFSENALSKLVRLRRSKITCYPSYADYRPKTNAVILLEMGHTLRGECIQEE
jgi:hypothetical protein